MSKSIKIVLGLGLLAMAAACARQEEPVTYAEPPAPIEAEPSYSKY